LKDNYKIAIRTAIFSILGNIFLAMGKGIAGVLGNSFALIADAIESTTDVFSSIILLLGLRYANKPPDEDHPYGHGKAEPLITFIIVGFLITSASIILWQAFENMQNPSGLPEVFTLYVLAGIILVKELSYQFVNKKSRETKSSSLAADAWHHRSDAITSLAAFIGISFALIMGEDYEIADDIAAIFAAFFIYYNAYLIFKPALGEIMDVNLYPELAHDIEKVAKNTEGIINTEKCWIRKSGMNYIMDIHIRVKSDITVKAGHEIAHLFQRNIQKQFPEMIRVQIHVEPWKE
jgi:cation diffusion facilitator family transporter